MESKKKEEQDSRMMSYMYINVALIFEFRLGGVLVVCEEYYNFG